MVLIARTRAAVLHIQSKDDFIAATIAGRLTGRKVVWTDHMDLRYIFEGIAKPLRNPVGKMVFWAAHRAHHIILISQNEHRLVTAQFKDPAALQRQITLVNNGVIDQRNEYPASKAGKDFVFCLASRMVANKGIGEAIAAFGLLEQKLGKNHEVRLEIYGDGPDFDQFKEAARSNEHITFHGHEPNALAKISAADVFMLPSYREGFSIALLEATMLGKAIIASDVDSNSEIITPGKTGLLAKVKDPESLAAAMYELATNPELKHALEAAARQNFEEHFDLETIVRTQLKPLYLG